MAAIMIMETTTNATTEMEPLEISHHACFACGPDNPIGLNLQFEVNSEGVASAAWLPSPAFQSYPDRLHGGIIATLMDSAMVHALSARGITGVTVELTIRYRKSVDFSEPVHVSGSVLASHHGLHSCLAELHQHGMCAVRASAKFMCGQKNPSSNPVSLNQVPQ